MVADKASAVMASCVKASWVKVLPSQGLLAAPRSVRGRPSQVKGAPRRSAIADATPEGPLRGQATVLPFSRAAPPGGRCHGISLPSWARSVGSG